MIKVEVSITPTPFPNRLTRGIIGGITVGPSLRVNWKPRLRNGVADGMVVLSENFIRPGFAL